MKATFKVRVAALATISVLALSVPASALVNVSGGPLTGLNPAGDTVKLTLTNFPTTGGIYIEQCRTGTTRPTAALCNPLSAVWVSNATGASFKPTDQVSIPVLGSFGSVTCLTQGCSLFFRMDHTAPLNTSEDRWIALTFTGQNLKPVDEITVKLNGTTLAATGATLAYNTPGTLSITAKSTSAITKKVTGDCSLVGNTLTALKPSGTCDLEVTSAGDSGYTGVTMHYLITMVPGVQTFDFKAPKLIVGTKLLWPAKSTTNMGQKLTLVIAPGSPCVVKTKNPNVMLVATAKGTCTFTISAAAKDGWFNAFTKTYSIPVKVKK